MYNETESTTNLFATSHVFEDSMNLMFTVEILSEKPYMEEKKTFLAGDCCPCMSSSSLITSITLFTMITII